MSVVKYFSCGACVVLLGLSRRVVLSCRTACLISLPGHVDFTLRSVHSM